MTTQDVHFFIFALNEQVRKHILSILPKSDYSCTGGIASDHYHCRVCDPGVAWDFMSHDTDMEVH